MTMTKVVVSKDDPGLRLEWNEAAVDAFMVIANAGIDVVGGLLPARLTWIMSAARAVSRATFTNDVISTVLLLWGMLEWF